MAAQYLKEEQLTRMAHRFHDDAKALYAAGRYTGAVYIEGYVIELLLKCVLLKKAGWKTYPPKEVGTDIQGKPLELHDNSNKTFLIHNVVHLALLAGVYDWLVQNHKDAFSVIQRWNEQSRYKQEIDVNKAEASEMMAQVKMIANALTKEFKLS